LLSRQRRFSRHAAENQNLRLIAHDGREAVNGRHGRLQPLNPRNNAALSCIADQVRKPRDVLWRVLIS